MPWPFDPSPIEQAITPGPVYGPKPAGIGMTASAPVPIGAGLPPTALSTAAAAASGPSYAPQAPLAPTIAPLTAGAPIPAAPAAAVPRAPTAAEYAAMPRPATPPPPGGARPPAPIPGAPATQPNHSYDTAVAPGRPDAGGLDVIKGGRYTQIGGKPTLNLQQAQTAAQLRQVMSPQNLAMRQLLQAYEYERETRSRLASLPATATQQERDDLTRAARMFERPEYQASLQNLQRLTWGGMAPFYSQMFGNQMMSGMPYPQ